MNFARKMIGFAIGCFSCIAAGAQGVDCSLPGVSKLVCLVPFRTGANNAGATAQASLFSGPIGAQLSQLPLAASAPGAIILTIHGNPEVYPNLGPILVDRPDSVGQGRLVVGFSAQQFNFNHLDGIGIGSIPFVYQVDSAQLKSQGITEYFAQTIHASVKYDQYVMLATYGLPKKTDISVIVPYIRISIGAAALNPSQYTTVNGGITTTGSAPGGFTSGSARGLGDLVFNAKHVLWSGGEAGRGSAAAGAAIRFPTGDALNYLGSGAYGFNLYALAAYKAKFSPHVKLGYAWNTNSVLLNIGGTGPNQRLPGGLEAALGADYAASRHFTIAADILTHEFQNSPSIVVGNYTGATSNPPSTPPDAVSQLPTVTTVDKTFTTANLSGGLKWKPFLKKGLVLYGNVLVQVNDVGLRSDPSPSVGISYNFRP